MQKFSVRWQNFHGFPDTGWIDFRPVTVLIGPNNSGKTSLLLPLLLLKQTLLSNSREPALVSRGELVNAGAYRDLVRNHDVETDIRLALRWREQRHEPDEGEELEHVGHYPPGRVGISLSAPFDRRDHIQLSEFEVTDIADRRMIRRRLTKRGNYSLGGPLGAIQKAEGPPESRVDEEVRSLMRSQTPSNFYFHGTALFSEAVRNLRAELEHDRSPDADLSSYTLSYMSAVDWVESHIQSLLHPLTYLGPLRAPLSRVYEISDDPPENVGIDGGQAPEVLFRRAREPEMDAINQWLSRRGLPSQLRTKNLGENAFSLGVELRGGTSVADLGFGFSQILPLVTQTFLSERGDYLVATQPEIHLNPRLQVEVGSLIPEILDREAGIAIETHSEHLLLRIRRLIADDQLNSKQVALYFVERSPKGSSVREVPIDEIGHIDSDVWPKGFFSDGLKESMELSSLQSSRVVKKSNKEE